MVKPNKIENPKMTKVRIANAREEKYYK